jgi:hypothetical protein
LHRLSEVYVFIRNQRSYDLGEAGRREVSVRIKAVYERAAWFFEHGDGGGRDGRRRLLLTLTIRPTGGAGGILGLRLNPLG